MGSEADENTDLTPAERELFEQATWHRGYRPVDRTPEPDAGPTSAGSATAAADSEAPPTSEES